MTMAANKANKFLLFFNAANMVWYVKKVINYSVRLETICGKRNPQRFEEKGQNEVDKICNFLGQLL